VPPLALTAGDPSGIGPEVAIAAWRLRDAHQVPPFYLLSDPELVARRAEAIGQPVKVRTAGAETAAALFADALPVVPLGSRFSDRPGEPDPGNAAGVIQSVDRAVDDVRRLGGSVLAGPYDAPPAFSQAVVADPGGAVLSLSQLKSY